MDEDVVILLADASSSAAQTGELLLAGGFRLEHARDAEAARAWLSVAPSHPSVAVVAADLPVDGWGLLAALRGELGRGVLVPVVMLAPAADSRLRALALDRGAEDLLEQPPDGGELLARVRRCLQAKSEVGAMLDEAARRADEAFLDPLTGLFNHRFFERRMDEELRRAQRYDAPLALLRVDLDQFPELHQRFGDPVADELLRQAAQALRGSVRHTDLICRCAGERFALVLPQTHLPGSLTVAERVARELAKVRAGPAGMIRVTASMGLASFPGPGVLSAHQLLGAAEEALAEARPAGNRIVLHRPPAPVEPKVG